MLDIAVARKYARALFEASRKAGNIPRVNADLEAILSLREEDSAFLSFLVSPEVPTDQKHAFIQAVFEPRVDVLVVGFLRLLVDKGRIVNLPGICQEFRALSEEQRGLIRAQVVTAVPLDAAQEQKLTAELSGLTGKQVVLEKRQDPAILGGVVVHLGDKIIDRSIRRGLRNLSDSLLGGELGATAQ